MDDKKKKRIKELLFYLVPNPDEEVTDELIERSASVSYEEGERLKAEFRSLIESLDDHPKTRRTVLAALDDMESNSEHTEDDKDWLTIHSVMGRRIHRALAQVT